jgi:hypothetical protein
MPLRVRVEPDLQVIFVDGEGVVTDEDLLTYVREYLTEGEFHGYNELFDLSAADLRDLTYAGLSSVAAAAAATDSEAEPTKIGILVSETLAKGLSRMYQSLRESRGGRRHTRVFMDRAECREWLELGA